MLSDFIGTYPIDIIRKTEITDDKVQLPANIPTDEFYAEFQAEIEATTLTPEKALYIGAICPQKPTSTAKDMLNSRLKF